MSIYSSFDSISAFFYTLIIPPEVGASSRVEVESMFNDNWEGKKNIPVTHWKEVEDYISKYLTDEAIVSRLEK